jgi:Ca-activated chloride channel homolog
VRRSRTLATRLLAGAVFAAVALAPALAGAGPATATTGAAHNSLLLLLDASGSMRDNAGGGQTRIAAAKQALNGLVSQLPATSTVGIRVFGATKDHGCDDTQLIAPVAPLDRPALLMAIRRFSPRGDTPIGASLRAAAKDLKNAPGRKTVVLVSDGEDNCAPPAPCDVARQLSKQGLDLRVEAIGFQVNAAARAQLACIAKATGGSYFDAPDARALTGQLTALSLRAYRDFQPIGTPITGTADATSAPTMTPGPWVDELAPGESRSYAVDITDASVPVVNASLIAGATQPKLSVPENLIVTLNDLDGNECSRGFVSQTVATFTASATVTGTRAAADGANPCARPGPHILTVQRPSTSGQGVNTLEILFSEIGAPSATADPAPPVVAGPNGGSTGHAVSTRGGTSYGDAPLLGSGSWKDTLRVGETLYYRVPVGWGQSLSAGVRFSLLASTHGGTRRMMPVVEVHDALRVDPLNRKIAQLSSGGTRSISIDTPAIKGPTATSDPVAPFRIAGDEYLVINGATFLDDSKTATATMRIDLKVAGTQVEGPRLAIVGAESSPSPTPTTTKSTPSTKPKPGKAATTDSSGAPVGLLVGGVVVLLAAVAALAVIGRRRASGRARS